MNKYRTHNCNELNNKHANNLVTISGWIHKKRDHGNLLFIDLRDNYGITQCVVDKDNKNFTTIEKIPLETVLKINGIVLQPPATTGFPVIFPIFRRLEVASCLRMFGKTTSYENQRVYNYLC